MNIGLIGHGRFGKLIVKHLPEIKVWDKISFEGMNSLEEVLYQGTIILAVPMRDLEETCKMINPRLQFGQHIVDVCSLKTFSEKVLDENLKSGIRVTGTHPLFGPQSAKDGIKGQKIVITNYKNRLGHECVAEFCKVLGLKVIFSTPEEHDKQMAISQAFTHFIGRVAEQMGITDKTRVEMSTQSYEDLMDIVKLVQGGSKELFIDMETLNPFAKEMRCNFLKHSNKLNLELNNLIP